MALGNNTTLVGNLTRDPELRFTPSAKAVVNFGLAVNRRFQKANGEWDEVTSFFNVVAWAQLAENVASSFKKGDRVIVAGELDQRSWETDGGEKRSTVEVKADEVGASTRFAEVAITKNARKGADQAPPRDEPFESNGTTPEPAAVAAGADEEPF